MEVLKPSSSSWHGELGHFESPLVSDPCGLCIRDVRDGEGNEGMSLGDENPG